MSEELDELDQTIADIDRNLWHLKRLNDGLPLLEAVDRQERRVEPAADRPLADGFDFAEARCRLRKDGHGDG